MSNLDSILKSRDITVPTNVHLVKAMVFPVVMYGCESWDYKESWALKNWCFWTVVLEKTLESPLDCKEMQPVHPKRDQSWVFTGRIDVEAETPILWPPDAKTWLIWKDPDAGKDWGQEEKGTTEDEMAGWHHRVDAHEFGWTPGVGDRQGGLACCSSWVTKSWTWLSDWTELILQAISKYCFFFFLIELLTNAGGNKFKVCQRLCSLLSLSFSSTLQFNLGFVQGLNRLSLLFLQTTLKPSWYTEGYPTASMPQVCFTMPWMLLSYTPD